MLVGKNTLEILEQAGWYEGRKIDISGIEENLKSIGYKLSEEAREFLREFGKLTIIDNDKRMHSTDESFGDYFKHSKFKWVENYAGENMVLVGEIYDGNMLLFISDSGKVCSETGKLGDNGLEAFDRLLSGKGSLPWGSY